MDYGGNLNVLISRPRAWVSDGSVMVFGLLSHLFDTNLLFISSDLVFFVRHWAVEEFSLHYGIRQHNRAITEWL